MACARTKLIVGGLVMAGAVTYLAVAGVKSGWTYYLDVDAFLLNPACQAQRTRLHGEVSTDALDLRPGELFVRFDLLGRSGRVPVAYKGPIPDLFRPGRQVVVEGTLDAAGIFQADTLLTKCASKYMEDRAGPPEARTATPQ
jgi:cytochrome c-type biogenesis protein CcmE